MISSSKGRCPHGNAGRRFKTGRVPKTPASSYRWGHDRAFPVQTGRVCKTRLFFKKATVSRFNGRAREQTWPCHPRGVRPRANAGSAARAASHASSRPRSRPASAPPIRIMGSFNVSVVKITTWKDRARSSKATVYGNFRCQPHVIELKPHAVLHKLHLGLDLVGCQLHLIEHAHYSTHMSTLPHTGSILLHIINITTQKDLHYYTQGSY